jgi:hypothetical protein
VAAAAAVEPELGEFEDEGEDEVGEVGVEPAVAAAGCPLCCALALLPEPDPHPIQKPAMAKTNKTLKNRSVAVLMKSPGEVFELWPEITCVFTFSESATLRRSVQLLCLGKVSGNT